MRKGGQTVRKPGPQRAARACGINAYSRWHSIDSSCMEDGGDGTNCVEASAQVSILCACRSCVTKGVRITCRRLLRCIVRGIRDECIRSIGGTVCLPMTVVIHSWCFVDYARGATHF